MKRSALARFGTKEPTCCGVCHRHAWWIGYAPTQRGTILWWCDECCMHPESKRVYKMPAKDLDAYEEKAVEAAGDHAGQYLDELGKTDLAKLSEDEWKEFLRRIVVGFENNMRRMITTNEAPF